MERIVSLVLAITVFLAVHAFADTPLEPDPTAFPITVFYGGSPGIFVPRTSDLFFDDDVNYDVPDSVSLAPYSLRAVSRFDEDVDPLYDQAQKLSHVGISVSLQQYGLFLVGGKPTHFESGKTMLMTAANDDVLYIKRAVFYDDNESDALGGFAANWKIYVMPVDLSDGFGETDYTILGRLDLPLRGPFWSGEKLEVGDTGNGFAPQVMHYQNLGIWDWNWSSANTVIVKVQEGDSGFFDDDIATIVVQREEKGPITISDTGDLVDITLTGDGRFHRHVSDSTRIGPHGYPRVLNNPDGMDVDLTFETTSMTNKALPQTSGGRPCASNHSFTSRYAIGDNVVRASEASCGFPWVNPGFTEGSKTKRLRFIDNLSYIPGWDCKNIDPFDVDDDFQFSIDPEGDEAVASVSLGGCGDKSSLFFRAAEVDLPAQVEITRTEPVEVFSGKPVSLFLPMDPTKGGAILTELFDYHTAGDNDFSFSINRTFEGDGYRVDASAFDGNAASSIRVRATLIEWPVCLPVFIDGHRLSTRNAPTGTAHGISDIPIPYPIVGDAPQQYFVTNELLEYHTAGDPDLQWGMSFEPLYDPVRQVPTHIGFQLSSANAGADDAYVTMAGSIWQMPVALGMPVASISATSALAECTSPLGARLHFSGGESMANELPLISEDSLVRWEWLLDGLHVADGAEVDIDVPLGHHVVGLRVEDQCGFQDRSTVEVDVVDTTPPNVEVTVSPTDLWPPNHRLQSVNAKVIAVDVCDIAPVVELSEIRSSEASDGQGDGHISPDIQGADYGSDDRQFSVRAERNGTGTGRSYRITYLGRDASGNVGSGNAQVNVPHDSSGKK